MKWKILLVEDVESLRKSILDYLRDDGFVADGAADGEEGLYKAMHWEYDLMILDLMLPGIDGFEVLQKLRAADRSLPVILLTARSAPPDRNRGLDAGAADYLVKPFEMEDLMSRVRQVLEPEAAMPEGESGD